MKGAMAAMVYAGGAIAALDLEPAHTVHVTGVVMEEVHEGHAMRYVDEMLDLELRAVVLGEASEMDVKRGHRGRCECTIEVSGDSCHGSAPERGINPLYHAAPMLERIRELNGETGTDEFLGDGTIAPTNVEVRTPSNCAVPSGATIHVDRRITTGEDRATVLAELDSVIEAAVSTFGDDVDAEADVATFEAASYTGYSHPSEKYYPAWTLSERHELVDRTRRVADAALDRPVDVTKWTFSTDGNYTMGVAGIPTVGFGPAEERYAHTVNDQVDLDDLVRSAVVYAGIALAE
jgi:putative selenium metabolism hydrolase